MMLGSLALVGLKVTSPNMEATANAYLTTAQTLDLAVMSNYGLAQADQEELEQIEGAEVEFGYLTDVTMEMGRMPFVCTPNQSKFQPSAKRGTTSSVRQGNRFGHSFTRTISCGPGD